MLWRYSPHRKGATPLSTESQLRNTELRTRIHRLIDQGSLPVMRPERVAGGYGCGRKCDACDEPITRDQIEYEVEGGRYGVPLELHLGCYVLWQLDCAERPRESRS